MLTEAKKVLKKFWGYPDFRPPQDKIITKILKGEDCLALLPTGGGKSLCYQIPALLSPGLTLVVSPLISLMQDQVGQLKARGIPAEYIKAGSSRADVERIINNAVYGAYQLLYISPERLETEFFLERLDHLNLSLIAIDEAHCVSQWGYDFRPSYLNIARLKDYHPEVPVLALTATATVEVTEDICTQLKIDPEHKVAKSFLRTNLALAIRKVEAKHEMILKVLKGVEGSGIVYARSRKACEQLSKFLISEGFPADYYHAGLTAIQREKKQQAWMLGKIRIIVATNAFGMGIDKADVRFVIHHQAPDNLEAYFQEAGRAGRDGGMSYAVLICNSEDERKLKSQIKNSTPGIKSLKAFYGALLGEFRLAIGEETFRSYPFDLSAFCSKHKLNANRAMELLEALKLMQVISMDAGFTGFSSVRLKASYNDLLFYSEQKNRQAKLIQYLLRNHGGITERFVKIKEPVMAEMLGWEKHIVKQTLRDMDQLNIISYNEVSNEPAIAFNDIIQDPNYLRLNIEQLRTLKRLENERLSAMLGYLDNQKVCRSKLILKYFGESSAKACGICDICQRKTNKPKAKEIRARILNEISQAALSIEELSMKLADIDGAELAAECQELIAQGSLSLAQDQTIRLTAYE